MGDHWWSGAIFAVAAGLIGASAGGAEGASLERPPRIVIHVYDRGHLPPATVAAAGRQVTAILGKAGLASLWRDRTNCGSPERRTPDCSEPVGATDVVLTILPRASARLNACGVMGLALLPVEAGAATRASVFLDDATRLARDGRATLAQILGHAVAHEIGHLLLGSHAHSAQGIMRAAWTGRDVDLAARGQLVFTADQEARLQAEAATRESSSP